MNGIKSRRLFGQRALAGIVAVALLLPVLLAGCSIPERSAAVPEGRTSEAVVPGMPANIRFFVEEDPQPFIDEAAASLERARAWRAGQGQTGPLPPATFLAVSGGGDNGAFAAGLLKGWTEAGDRPVFDGISGVSTGALIAPLAFLGPEYDQTLREAYTNISQRDIFLARRITAVFFDVALADTQPLFNLVSSIITAEFLAMVAAEYHKGRLLLVGTTDLDARQPVIWNMTAIANVGTPAALQLFRKILVASSSVPGGFPPVMIDVEVASKPYQEMHVDGGAMTQVFLYPPQLNLRNLAAKMSPDRKRVLYVIRNARLAPDWASVDRQTLSIAFRAVDSLLHTQGLGDLHRIYLTAQRDGLDYNLAYISTDFTTRRNERFETAYMRSLFDYAYEKARHGYPWQKYPPGFSPGATPAGGS